MVPLTHPDQSTRRTGVVFSVERLPYSEERFLVEDGTYFFHHVDRVIGIFNLAFVDEDLFRGRLDGIRHELLDAGENRSVNVDLVVFFEYLGKGKLDLFLGVLYAGIQDEHDVIFIFMAVIASR